MINNRTHIRIKPMSDRNYIPLPSENSNKYTKKHSQILEKSNENI